MVQQLQADNAELQAELQHLAAALRAALSASPDAGNSLLGSVDFSRQGGVAQLDGIPAPHDHTHLTLQQLGRGSPAAAGCDCSGGSGSWPSVDGAGLDSAAASLLSSIDTPPAASDATVGTTGAAVPPVYHQPTSVSRATLSCSMQHPGSICCSKLSSTVDASGAACTVSLHTTTR